MALKERATEPGATRRSHSAVLVIGLLLAQLAVGLPWLAMPAAAAYEGQFLWPMDGTVTSIYWECRSDCARWHRGIDIANGCDTRIYAARSGTATVLYDEGGYGNYVTVDHADGYTTLYAHMDTVAVDSGDAVTTATVLGYEGQTGAATGCHVHFEIRQDDNGPSAEVKQFLPGKLDEHKTRGAQVPFDLKLLKASVTTDVLNGPNLDDVAAEGDEVIGTAQAGESYVSYTSWKNSAGQTWYVVYFNGRLGWVRSTDMTEAGGTVQRMQVDGALNVRSGAGTNNADIGDVYGGQEYLRLGSAQDGNGKTWYKISYDGSNGGSVGWVHGDYGTAITYNEPAPPADDLTGYKFAVDAGHGGTDPGASGFGDDEKTFTLDIARRVRDLLEADGATVFMTRDCDCTTSLQSRVDLANNNDVDRFVSVHANSCGSCGGHGTETYYHDSLPSTSTSADLASKVQSRMVSALGTTDRGVKQADFFVLRETTMPAVLVETAFMDHSGDNAVLSDAAKRQEAAKAILHALQAHLGVSEHDPATDPPPPPPGDTDPPAISVTSPDLTKWYSGTVTVKADITDASALAWARARIDTGAWVWDSTAPHQWSFDTTTVADGSRDLHLQAQDSPGNQADLHKTLKVDNSPPTATITSPDDGQFVFWSVDVEVDASDAGSGVSKVQFFIDGELRFTDNAAPWEWTWDAFFEAGSHDITAKAFDVPGHTAQDTISVFVL